MKSWRTTERNQQEVERAAIHAFVSETRSLMGRFLVERPAWNTLVTADAIRHFAHGTSDGNPLWCDRSHTAAQGDHLRLIAPPAFLASICYPVLHGAIPTIRLTNWIGEVEFYWFHSIYEGDRISGAVRLTDCHASTTNDGRPLACLKSEATYRNQSQHLVAVARTSLVRMPLAEGEQRETRECYHYTAQELAQIELEIRNHRRTLGTLKAEDSVTVTELPHLVRGPLNIGDLVCWNAAIGPAYRSGSVATLDAGKSPHSAVRNPLTGALVKDSQQHEDPWLSPQRGMPLPFDNGLMRFAWVCPLLTDWSGSQGFLQSMKLRILKPNLYGDTTRYRGIVDSTESTTRGSQHCLSISGTNQLGEETTSGRAVVVVPRDSESHLPQNRRVFSGSTFAEVDSEGNSIHTSTLAQILQQAADKQGDQIAINAVDGNLTYAELWKQAQAQSHLLRQQGVVRGVHTGVCLPRDSRLVVSIFAILVAGGVYVPLSLDSSSDRLKSLISAGEVTHVLTDTQRSERFPAESLTIINRDHTADGHREEILDSEVQQVSDLAYILLTSGSQGTPKAVGVTWQSLAEMVESLRSLLTISPDDVYLHTASIEFSAAMRQFFLPLCSGARLVLASDNGRRDSRVLLGLMQRHEVTVWDTVPSLWESVISVLSVYPLSERRSMVPSHLRAVLSTGEPLKWEVIHAWWEHTQLSAIVANLYSQTETAGTVCCCQIPMPPAANQGIVPLGKPVPGVEVLLVNEQSERVEKGETGEIVIRSTRLADRYMNDLQQTSERFPREFTFSEARAYRTGDLARWNDAGVLEYAGRSDRRIKLRGFRIDLNEVEHHINAVSYPVPAVAVVQTRGKKSQLMACLETGELSATAVSALRQQLQSRVPDYMVPQRWECVPHFPRTVSDKIDRQQILQNLRPGSGESDRRNTLLTPVEQKVVEIWSDILGTRPRLKDNFFELGGDSLDVVTLAARIETEFGISLPPEVVYTSPTLVSFAVSLEIEQKDRPIVPFRHGTGTPLFCLPLRKGSSYYLRRVLQFLQTPNPVYCLQPELADDDETASTSVEEIAAGFLKTVCELNPQGPFFLLGYSFAGTLAFELAHQLSLQGKKVSFVFLLDSYAPEFEARLDRISSWLNWLTTWDSSRHGTDRKTRIQMLAQSMLTRFPKQALDRATSNAEAPETLWTYPNRLSDQWTRALDRYVPQKSDVPLTLLQATKGRRIQREDLANGWAKLTTRPVDIHRIPTDHFQLMREPYAAEVANILQHLIESRFLSNDSTRKAA